MTDTRLTPRAVSRLLGQVDSSSAGGGASTTSPLYDHHLHHRHSTSPAGSPSNNPIEPRSILQNGTPPPAQPGSQQQQGRGDRDSSNRPARERTPSEARTPQQQDQPGGNGSNNPRVFNPFQPPPTGPFFHPAALAAAAAAGHPLHPHALSRLDSPPMGSSLLHPALQNPSEYVERLREMSMESSTRGDGGSGGGSERNTRVGSDTVVVRDRGDNHHHHASLREYPSVRGLRDRSTGGTSIMIGNDFLEMINSRAGSAGGGSDSGGESNSYEMGPGSGAGMYCKWSEYKLFLCLCLVLPSPSNLD